MPARKLQTKLKTRRHLTQRRRGGLVYKKSRRQPSNKRREVPTPNPRRVFLFSLFVLAQLIFLGSELFDIRDITVSGQTSISRADLLEQAGLSEQARFWSVSPERMQTRLLQFHELKKAEVERVFPSLVTISVSQRSPRFQVAMTAQEPEWYESDPDGVVLQKAGSDSKLPRVMLDQPVVKGQRLTREGAFAVRESVRWLHGLIPGPPWFYHIDENYEVTAKTTFQGSALTVKVGQVERMAYKADVFKALLEKLKAQKHSVEMIDLRYATPVVRMRPEKESPSPTRP